MSLGFAKANSLALARTNGASSASGWLEGKVQRGAGLLKRQPRSVLAAVLFMGKGGRWSMVVTGAEPGDIVASVVC